MSIQRIREFYNVPAKRGMRVVVDGKPGVIVGSRSDSMHLNVRFDGIDYPLPVHPTWRVEYDVPTSHSNRPEATE